MTDRMSKLNRMLALVHMLDALARLRRTRVVAGPLAPADPQVLMLVQQTIVTGQCLELQGKARSTIDTAMAWLRRSMPGRTPPSVWGMERALKGQSSAGMETFASGALR